MTLVGVYERRGLEYHTETGIHVPPKGYGTFAFTPPQRARLHRFIANISHAGPVQRYRCWHGMNIPTDVTMLTQYKRRSRAWRAVFIESINCRTMEALRESVPLMFFAPTAVDVRMDLPIIETNVPVTVRLRSRYALEVVIVMRCVFKEAGG